jgi:hypothetical protein
MLRFPNPDDVCLLYYHQTRHTCCTLFVSYLNKQKAYFSWIPFHFPTLIMWHFFALHILASGAFWSNITELHCIQDNKIQDNTFNDTENRFKLFSQKMCTSEYLDTMVLVDRNMGNSKERGWEIRALLQTEAYFISSHSCRASPFPSVQSAQ